MIKSAYQPFPKETIFISHLKKLFFKKRAQVGMHFNFSLSRKISLFTEECFAGPSALLLWLGIFPIWNRLLSWLTFSGPTSSVWEEPVVRKEFKYKNIPVLEDYKKDPLRKLLELDPL